MPTFNQLVRKGRTSAKKKSTAPALQRAFNSLKKVATNNSAPQPALQTECRPVQSTVPRDRRLRSNQPRSTL